MAEVAVTLRLMPEGSEVDLDLLESEVRKRIKVHSVAREPIAFGLLALRVITTVEDAEGGTESLEKELSGIPGVGNVQVLSMTRLP
ncbi:MAG: elongation factor 1-beta [Candidatus Hadarchaeales archaeon]